LFFGDELFSEGEADWEVCSVIVAANDLKLGRPWRSVTICDLKLRFLSPAIPLILLKWTSPQITLMKQMREFSLLI
jgi:hypothetical protein